MSNSRNDVIQDTLIEINEGPAEDLSDEELVVKDTDGLLNQETKTYPKASKYITFFAPIDDDALDNDDRSVGKKLLCDAFVPNLIETPFVLGLTGFATTYLNHLDTFIPWYRNPLLYSSMYTSINLISRIVMNTDLCIKKTFCLPNNPKTERAMKIQGARLCRSVLFALANDPINIVTHEGGHSLTALAVYENAQPKIYLKGGLFMPDGGYTRISSNKLSALGETIGTNNSAILFNANGSTADMVGALFKLMCAQIVSNKFPEIALYLRVDVFLIVMKDILYALAAYDNSNCYDNYKPKTSDFCSLKEEGISPALMVAAMAGLMLIVQLGLSLTSCLVSRSSCHNEAKVEELKEEERNTFRV